MDSEISRYTHACNRHIAISACTRLTRQSVPLCTCPETSHFSFDVLRITPACLWACRAVDKYPPGFVVVAFESMVVVALGSVVVVIVSVMVLVIVLVMVLVMVMVTEVVIVAVMDIVVVVVTVSVPLAKVAKNAAAA